MKPSENLLLIDTTRERLLVARVGSDGVEVRTEDTQRRHSECLNEIVSGLVPDLRGASAFAVVNAHGSWTGVRVGVVAVKAWSLATGRPIIELPAAESDEELFKLARAKYDLGEFTEMHRLEPYYDAEFKVTQKQK